MIVSLLILLLVMICLDARFLKREDAALFTDHFSLRSSYLVFLTVFIVLTLAMAGERLEALDVLIFIVLLPYYLFKRSRLLTALGQRQERFHLATDAVGVVLMWLFGGVVISTFMGAVFDHVLDFDSLLGEMVFSAVGSSVFLLMLVYEASRRFSGKGFFYNVALTRGGNGFLKLFLFPMLAGLMFAIISVYIIFARDVSPATPLSEMIAETQSSYILLVFLLMAVGVAPLVEEIIFRGYFFHVLRELKGIVFTVPVISLSFAVLHVGQYWGDWMAIVMITLIGFALTLFRLWAGSTMASCTMHYVYNGAVTFIPALMMLISNPAYVQYHANFDRLTLVQKEELLRQAIEKEPDLADAYYELANLYLQENRDIDGALKAIEQALAYFPDDRIFLETKALALEGLSRYGEALKIRQELLRKALSK